MKNKIADSIAITFAAAIAFLCAIDFTARATPQLLAGTLVTVNNTTNASASVPMLNYNPTTQQITVQHGALTATNAFSVQGRFTLDNTNYLLSGSVGVFWYPNFTNACTEVIPPNYFSITPQFSLFITSTNSIQYGANYGQ